MAEQKFFISDLEEAYRKLKHYIYYDSTNILLRKQIADFESQDMEKAFRELKSELNQYARLEEISPFWEDLFSRIDYWILPKAFEEKNDSNKEARIITNKVFSEEVVVSKVFHLVNAPIEIHIISVLWIIKYGYVLERTLAPPPYGYVLSLKPNKESVADGLKLFKPYFKEYQNWRDKAIKAAKNLIVSEKVDAAIVGMDVKNYYDSIKLDFNDLAYTINTLHGETYNPSKLDPLTRLLREIHFAYFKKRRDYGFDSKGSKVGLPIGLLSSGVLGNWCLKEFDLVIKDKLNPVYYGRYVDDILIVISNPKHDEQTTHESLKESFFKKYFIDRGILQKDEKNKKDEKDEQYIIKETGLIIQKDKLTLMYFDHKEPLTLLENFEHELRKNSSEFRLLPEEDALETEFQREANAVVYSGSKFKLRSVQDLAPDKFGASKFLAKKIFAALQSDNVKDKATVNQLLKFFKNQRALEFYHLWEKILTYFVISKQHYAINIFLSNLKKIFDDNLTLKRGSDRSSIKLKNNLREYLGVSIAMSLGLNPSCIDSRLIKTIDYATNQKTKTLKLIKNLRHANMIKHNYVFFPMLNFTRSSSEGNANLVDKNLFSNLAEENADTSKYFDLPDYIFEYSPRFVHFHEIAIHVIRRKLNHSQENRVIDKQKSDIPIVDFEGYLDEAFDLFYQINYLKKKKTESTFQKKKKYLDLKAQYFKVKFDSTPLRPYVDLYEVKIADYERKNTLKIALGNIMIHHANMQQSYFKKPIISRKRKAEINSLLNQVYAESREEKVDLFVLPEASIPYKWLGWMTEHCRKHQIMAVFGMEHWPVNNIVYNFMVTLLPTKISSTGLEETSGRDFNALIPVLRIKNHYSPMEVFELKGYRYNIPTPSPNVYHLFIWKGLHFAVFNCFELADISHRALFKSKVDFIVASEYNKDVNYFSNIVEATTRDVHCYFIQSNNSSFGDNRITLPGKTESKDLIKLKGGKNTTIVVDTIDIKSLRLFQLKDHSLQMQDKTFKPTPPWFDIKELEKRLGINLNS